MVLRKIGTCMIIAAILLTGCQNKPTNNDTEQNVPDMLETVDTEQSKPINTYNQEQSQEFDEPLLALPSEETIIYQGHVPVSSYDLIICKSPTDEYSIYVTDRGSVECRTYTKMNLQIPENITYDSYRLLPIVIGTGGSCDAEVIVEFMSNGVKSYHGFDAGFFEDSSNNFFYYSELDENDVLYLFEIITDDINND
ncbi:MAG: hypothetical protein VB118_04975 [Oscillospiraceae bacterium]|nr:hypothetical protein [Oscillospiraceae bacterium]